MCVVERTTYVDADGHHRSSERYLLCDDAIGASPCSNIQRSFTQSTVEGRPSSSRSTRRERRRTVITEGFNGRINVYKDVSRTSSGGGSSTHRHSGASLGSPVSLASSTSSPPVVPDIRAEPLSPLTARPQPLLPERERMPYPPTEPSSPSRRVLHGGTAVYEPPASLRLSGAARDGRDRQRRSPSVSSTTAEVHDAAGVRPPRPIRRPSAAVSFDMSGGLGPPTDPPVQESGHAGEGGRARRPSSPRVLRSALRRPQESREETERRQRELEAERHRRRQREEDERIARIDRDRMADRERRQRERQDAAAAREASRERRRRAEAEAESARERSQERRERHRREAARILESNRRREEDELIEASREAERHNVVRERALAEQRLSRDRSAFDDQLSREADALAQRSSAISRRLTDDSLVWPMPPVPPVPPIAPRAPVVVHNYGRSQHHLSNSFHEYGDSVIAQQQQQLRGARESLTESLGGMSWENAILEDDGVFDGYIEGRPSRASRREQDRWR